MGGMGDMDVMLNGLIWIEVTVADLDGGGGYDKFVNRA